jgi:hypothetical protein
VAAIESDHDRKRYEEFEVAHSGLG